MNQNHKLAVGCIVSLVVGVCLGQMIHHPRPMPMQDRSESKPPMHEMSNGTMMNTEENSAMHGAMTNMMAGLRDKKGDEFDQAFLSEMIVHHEGAVDMAEAALGSAKHEEIKTLSREIIKAQTKEINQMKSWQKTWYNQ